MDTPSNKISEDIEDALIDAQEELKRVDHIIYVSLKYTRTVDVIRNALNRVIATYNALITALLLHNGVEQIPKSPRLQVKKVLELYPEDKEITFNLNFYVHLRDLMIAKFDRKEEFRRGVRMITQLNNRTAFINIDYLEDHVDIITKDFFRYVKILILGEEEE